MHPGRTVKRQKHRDPGCCPHHVVQHHLKPRHSPRSSGDLTLGVLGARPCSSLLPSLLPSAWPLLSSSLCGPPRFCRPGSVWKEEPSAADRDADLSHRPRHPGRLFRERTVCGRAAAWPRCHRRPPGTWWGARSSRCPRSPCEPVRTWPQPHTGPERARPCPKVAQNVSPGPRLRLRGLPLSASLGPMARLFLGLYVSNAVAKWTDFSPRGPRLGGAGAGCPWTGPLSLPPLGCLPLPQADCMCHEALARWPGTPVKSP